MTSRNNRKKETNILNSNRNHGADITISSLGNNFPSPSPVDLGGETISGSVTK